MTSSDVQNSLIESALYLSVFGNNTTGNAVKEWVHVMFSKFSLRSGRSSGILMYSVAEERLPYAEGFTRPKEQLTVTSVLTMMSKIAAPSA
jgi:hypothetical protein